MYTSNNNNQELLLNCILLAVMCAVGFLVRWVEIRHVGQDAGWINFSLGFVLLAAFLLARIVSTIGLPRLSGYIFAGILAGPFVSGFLTMETVERLRLIDGLALSFIALAAGAELRFDRVRQRSRALGANIFLISVTVFGAAGLFILFAGPHFPVMAGFSVRQTWAFALLFGVIAASLSPASAIAIIDECRAAGRFTETVLGVIIVADILIIIAFTVALAISRQIVAGTGEMHGYMVLVLIGEIAISLIVGAVLGKAIAVYIERVGYDFILFLLFVAFAVTRISMGFNEMMDVHMNLSLHLEPLLICMSAGFFVRNFSRSGTFFLKSLDRTALPVYVLFFSLAGASLNFESLRMCWSFALCLVGIRAVGLFFGSWMAGRVVGDPKSHNRNAWMAYLTQAGVSLGLAQLVVQELPEIGIHLNTVVLAVIAVNQVIGPILFKVALNRVGESGRT